MKSVRQSIRIQAAARQALLGLLVLGAGLLPEQAVADRVNFAKYQKATASSQSSTYGPGFATDGIGDNFNSYRTGAAGPHWLEVEWPRPVTLASAHLYLGLDNVFDSSNVFLNFKIQYHDGSDWQDVPGAGVTGNTETEVDLIFGSAVTSDRFRLWSEDGGSRVVRELAMFPTNLLGAVEQGYPIGTDVRLSLAHKRPAVGTSTYNAFYPKYAVDGYVDNASRWVSDNASSQGLEVDLLVTNIVGSAHLYSGAGNTNALSDFSLQFLEGTNWTDIPGAVVTGNASTALAISFASNVSASCVRLFNNTSSYTRVKELLLFPPRAGGYPLGQDVSVSPPPAAEWEDYSDSSYRLRCGIAEERFLGFYDGALRFAAGTQPRDALGFELFMNYRDGSYRIRHKASGKCLAPSEIPGSDETPVVLEDYTAMPHQDWLLQPIDATYFRIVNAYNGMALQARFSNVAVGNSISVRPIDGSDLQRWYTQDPIGHPKKGIAATGNTVPWGTNIWIQNTYQLFTNCSWSYSWGRQSKDDFPFMSASHGFNPMQWGDYNWIHGSAKGPPENLLRELQADPNAVHYLGFNEPEHAGQGEISVSEAIRRWPRLEAMNVPMVAPVPASIQLDSSVSPAVPAPGWMNDFTSQADALGYRREYSAVHWYSNPYASNLINRLQDIYEAYGKPIWLTEFSVVDWVGTGKNWTKADNYNFLSEFMWRAESLPWLKRYSLFQYVEGRGSGFDTTNAPRSNTRNADGSLTAFGELYAGWDGVTNVLPDTSYHIHNRGEYRRLRNPATGDSTLTSGDPDMPAAGSHWLLTPGVTANTYRLVSTRDARLLNSDGVSVDLAAPAAYTPQTEWRLTADVHGWYFIEHPQSSKRLGDNGNGTFSMGLISSSTDEFRWRFVVPAVADNVPPVVNAGSNQTVMLSSSNWMPAQVETRAWYDASDTNSITLDSGKVSQWNDKSGNNNHAAQTNAVRRPSYQAGDPMVNNLPSIGDSSENGAIGLDTPSVSAKNIYVVSYYKDGVDSAFDLYSTLLSGPGSFGTYRVMGNSGTNALIESYNFNTAGTYKNGSTNSSNVVLPMAAGILKLKSTNSISQVYSLGYNAVYTNRDWQGCYSEWIFTDGTEDAATEQKIEGYLAHKWGLTSSLPAGHPYKAAAPGAMVATAALDATADHPSGDPVSVLWTLLDGPAPVSFGSSTGLSTTVTFSTNGVYVLRLTAECGYNAGFSDVTITVGTAAYAQWLIDFYGTTSIDDSMPASNGINSIRECYVAGLVPTNPAARFGIGALSVMAGDNVLQWDGVTGRLYNVYWSSNLMNGFNLLESDIPWDLTTFTDTVHYAEQDGFYRIEVRVDE